MMPDLTKIESDLQKDLLRAESNKQEETIILDALVEACRLGARYMSISEVLDEVQIRTLTKIFEETDKKACDEYGMLWVQTQEVVVDAVRGQPEELFNYTQVYEKYLLQKITLAVCKKIAEMKG